MSRITRRRFLATTASAVAAPALGLAQSGDVDVVIVGAGAAGIAAARRVAAAKRSFMVLEASDHIGGRCVTDTKVFGVPFDRGAHWVHKPDSNPLAKLAAGFDIYQAPRSQSLRIPPRAARDSELEQYFSALVRGSRAIIDAGRGKTDMPARAALPKDLGDWQASVEFALGPYSTGKDLSAMSAMDFARAGEREADGLCRQGYGALLAKLAAGVPVQLSTPVIQLEWGNGLEARTARGRVRARAAIVTVSTSVLAAGGLEFSPALPKRQLDACNALSLGTFEHIAFQAPGLGLSADDLVVEQAKGPRTAALAANMGGTGLCAVEVGGAFGRDLVRQGEAAMIAFANEWMAATFGGSASKITRAAVTRWSEDPLVRGSFSAASPGNADARRILLEPMRERVWFAGEAVHDTLWGTVGGAWESGNRAAEAALRKMGALKDDTETPQRKRRRS
ncbi:MAG: FAD-dependent oxidoreductase [Pseudolabrys sp.]|nr:FAD-dependent oxidoreductase [Pseudolabrys sp.]